MLDEAAVSELIGSAYPHPIPIAEGRLRRNWIARTSQTVPDDEELQQVEVMLQQRTAAALRDAYQNAASVDEIRNAIGKVRLIRLDELHLIIRTEFATPQSSVGDAAAISQWGLLQALDDRIPLAELQGIPRGYWFPLRRP